MLEVRDLAVRHGAVQAVQSLSLQVAAGEIVVLMGPNGAGKSSVMNTLAGLVQPIGGRVSLRGRDITGLAAAARVYEGVALVIEGRGVFADLTVQENLELGGYATARRRSRAARAQALQQVVELFPRLGERMGQEAGTLSGGEQQMLVIGRALMSEPALLLLDEPSLGLAPTVVEEIAAALRRLARERNIAVLVAEQNAALGLELADRGYVLHGGRVVVHDRCSALRAQHDLLALYMTGTTDV